MRDFGKNAARMRKGAADRAVTFVARYLVAVGALSLLGLNLGGILFLWIGPRLEERRSSIRTLTIWLCVIHVLVGIALYTWSVAGSFGNAPIRIVGSSTTIEPWALTAFLVVYLTAYCIPVALLSRPGVREQFKRNHCPNCGYDLRGNPEGVTGCAECGWNREDHPDA